MIKRAAVLSIRIKPATQTTLSVITCAQAQRWHIKIPTDEKRKPVLHNFECFSVPIKQVFPFLGGFLCNLENSGLNAY